MLCPLLILKPLARALISFLSEFPATKVKYINDDDKDAQKACFGALIENKKYTKKYTLNEKGTL